MEDNFMDDDFRLIGESALEIDRDEQDRADFLPSAEEFLRVLGRDNRVGIAARKPVPTLSGSLPPGRTAYDIALMLVVHAHPECKFDWSRLVVDLTPTPGAIIEDMTPTDIMDNPVDIETKIGADLKFTTILKAVDVQLNPEITRKRTVHFPLVTASGTGFAKAYWDFQSSGGGYIPSSRELRLLVSSPAESTVAAKFTVRAEIRLQGWQNLIPLRAKHGGLDVALTLVPPPHLPNG